MGNKTKKEKRPPVVTVMGHIDHGKSTLLDYIRKANTIEKEAGGITQHISAYEVKYDINGEKRRITFLDTPGHEAFCSIRERSARVADIAILIVSAEDGVKPQTLEALECIRGDEMPFIVALNKIDKPGANVDKVKQDLAENNVLVEGWGGTVPIVAVSAKTGEGIPELMEMIALQSDVEELSGDSSTPAEGVIIESNVNPQRGISATLVIKNGILKAGNFVATKGAYAPVRTIENYKGKNVPEATFSSPVRIVGWSAQPGVDSEFTTFSKKEDAIKCAAENVCLDNKESQENENGNCTLLEVVVKTDTYGSLDAIEHEFQKLNNDKVAIKIISKDIGSITEKDIKRAGVKKSLVLGFNVGVDESAKILAARDDVEIKIHKVIYELVDDVKERMKDVTPTETVEKVVGSIKILKTFSKNKDKQVIGGRVEEGGIKTSNTIKIYRKESLIGEGKIKGLQIQKTKVDEIKEGQECGIMVESKTEMVAGDILKVTALTKE